QCSLHITEYMASSPLVGRRPRISRIDWYSSDLSPRATYGCSRSGVAAAFWTVSAVLVDAASGFTGLLVRGRAVAQSYESAETRTAPAPGGREGSRLRWTQAVRRRSPNTNAR